MPSDRNFWIMIRIAVAETSIIFALLMYILQLKSVIRPLSTWPLAGIFAAIAFTLLAIAEKSTKTPCNSGKTIFQRSSALLTIGC